MAESTIGRSEVPLTRRALSLLLPSALNLGMAQILAPALNAMLARTSDPDAAIGGFAVALGISGLVALPQLRIQHLTLVFFEGPDSLRALRRFVGWFALLVTLLAVVVALTPLSGVVLERLFATDGALRDEAAISLVALLPFPALMVARMHLYGIALRAERPWIVWAGTAGGASGVLLGAALLLVGGVDGALVAAVAVTGGTTLEVVALLLATAEIREAPGGDAAATATQHALLHALAVRGVSAGGEHAADHGDSCALAGVRGVAGGISAGDEHLHVPDTGGWRRPTDGAVAVGPRR
jgi:hypothetical protein